MEKDLRERVESTQKCIDRVLEFSNNEQLDRLTRDIYHEEEQLNEFLKARKKVIGY